MIHPLWVILLWLRFPVTMTLIGLSILTLAILADKRHEPDRHKAPHRAALYHRHER